MALKCDIDMADCSMVNNIIYGESSKNDKVRSCSPTPRVHGSRSILLSIALDSRDESYHDKVQWESDNMVEDDPIAMLESLQLEYMTTLRQAPSVSKVTDTSSTWDKSMDKMLHLLSTTTLQTTIEM